MALCESQLDSNLPQAQLREESPRSDREHEPESGESPDTPESESPEKKPKLEPNGDLYQVPGGLPLAVDYRSPVSHFVPPAVELYAAMQKNEQSNSTAEPSSQQPSKPVKRKRGRPRVDKTSPEYLANLAARKQAREMAAMMNRNNDGTPTGEKRKRGRPRVDKTSPEYLARKRARELEALERKAKREYRRRTTGAKAVVKPPSKMAATKMAAKLPPRVAKKLPPRGKMVTRTKSGGKIRKLPQKIKKATAAVRKTADRKIIVRKNTKFIKRKDSAASTSGGETTPRVKRKYTKRTPTKKSDTPGSEKVKGKRGRPRKTDPMGSNSRPSQQPKIRVRSNLMPVNSEPITLDSDDEPDLGSPSQASDSLSLDENLRALRHIHEKYANIDKDELYEAHLLAANFKKPAMDSQRHREDDEVLSIRSSEGTASVKELDTRVEKLEDSSGSDSDSSSSGSGSSSSGSSSSSSSSSGSSSSDSSDSESEAEAEKKKNGMPPNNEDDSRSYGAWSYNQSDSSDSESEATREQLDPAVIRAEQDAISESENESADKSFQCHICKKWYSTRVTLKEPLDPAVIRAEQDAISESENESADKSFQCHICKKLYSTRVTLKIHRRGHQTRGGGGGGNSRSRPRASDRYECDCCNMAFNRREKLWEHKAEAHRGQMTVRCSVCRKCFEDDTELATHERTHTPDERVGRCSECGSTFGRYEQLRRHRVAAHGAAPAAAAAMPHACATCGKRFTHAHSLARHMHNHQKQLYRCVVCKASFERADQLAQHLNSHLATYKRLKP